jgi:hypothetical protein
MDSTEYLTHCVKNNIAVSFSKYGDGEHNCIFNPHGRNCDSDNYTLKLSNGLRQSFQYLVENTDNSYIGLWHDPRCAENLKTLVKREVKFIPYHTIIFDKKGDDKKATLIHTIKQSPLKKIVVCNPLLMKSKLLLNADEMVYIPFNNWFDMYFETVLNKVKELIGRDDGNHIVITSCGMSAKVLICELQKAFPKGIYLDFGSAIDTICTKRDSRGHNFGYEYYTTLLKDSLSEDWEDAKYNEIYQQARYKLGLHIPN